jgi:peptidoglycan-associated lipoprotein
MILKNIKNLALVLVLGFLVSACATSQKIGNKEDYYTGTDTVKFLAAGVPDRVFFATNRSTLHSGAKATLDKQAAYLISSKLKVVIEGHADERGTREYNLALGSRRANAVRDYLLSKGVPKAQLKTISYGKERPVNPKSDRLAWSQNRRAVTVKAN